MKRASAGSGGVIRAGGVEAKLVRSPRRTVALHVETDLSLVIKAPDFVTEAYLLDFLERRSGWALRQLERMRRIREAAPEWRDGGRVPFLGVDLPLRVEAAARSRARQAGGGILVGARDPGDPDEVRAAVERLYSREAAALLPGRLDACLARAARRRFPRPELKIRTMRARWGSCDSGKLAVTLNSRLLRFRPEVIDCVIMHELAHLKYRRHGPRFYGLLAELCPDYKGLQAELAEVYLE
jgi:predicted metal-dependent hydrolase